jgi:hypothetical protein
MQGSCLRVFSLIQLRVLHGLLFAVNGVLVEGFVETEETGE